MTGSVAPLTADPLALPLEDPILIFTLAMVVFLIGPLAIKRLGQPGIVGIVIFGALVGPGVLEIVPEGDPAIVLLGEVGLVYLLFTVGLEVDLQRFRDAPDDAAIFGLASFSIPFIGGTAITHVVLDLSLSAAALLAAVFASHTLLAYPVANRLNVTKNRAVTAVFGGILFTDTLALVVLAIVMGSIEGEMSIWLFAEVFASLAVLFGATWFLLPPVARWFFQNFSQESYFEFLFVMVAFFLAASAAEILDLAGILGAFVAGLALNQLVTQGGTLMNRIEFVGNAFFIPFFLLYVGTQVDPAVILDGTDTLVVTAVIVAVMLIGKAGAAAAVSVIKGYDGYERGVIFGLSTGQAAAALAITLIGVEAEVFTEEILNAVVLLLLITAVVSPWLTERYATRLALSRDLEPDGDAKDPNILLPLSHQADLQERLLDLSFAVKGNRGDEPVHAMTVVQPSGEGTIEEQVATVSEDLLGAVDFGAAAEVPVETKVRVNHNVASGIVQGAVEEQANQILMGWDARGSFSHRIFGSIIDQVLQRTSLPVLVSRLGHPINTTRQLFVVVPIGADHHEGFYEAVHTIKRLASNLGVPITVIVVNGQPQQFERLFGLVEEDASATFDGVEDWDTLLPELEAHCEPDDVIVTISPREGDVGWSQEIADLPAELAELPPQSFITIHPRQGKPEYDRQYLRIE